MNVDIAFFKRTAPVSLLFGLMMATPDAAFAYIGPGAGLSIVGSLLAFFAAIIVGIFGFLWFPIRRLLRKRKQLKEQKREQAESTSDQPADSQSAEINEPGKDDP